MCILQPTKKEGLSLSSFSPLHCPGGQGHHGRLLHLSTRYYGFGPNVQLVRPVLPSVFHYLHNILRPQPVPFPTFTEIGD